MSEQQRVVRPSAGVRWVVDTCTQSLRLRVVLASELMESTTSSRSTALTTAVSHDVTTILATFDRRGQFAVKSHVDFAVRLDRLHRALRAVGSGLTVWNLHASSGSGGTPSSDDAWDARGLMVCFNDVRTMCSRVSYRLKLYIINH